MNIRYRTVASVCLAFAGFSPLLAYGGVGVTVTAEPYDVRVLERLPLVVKIAIHNTGQAAVNTRFSTSNVGELARYYSLVLSDGKNEFLISCVGGIQACSVEMPTDISLQPGASVTLDRAISLMYRKPLARAVMRAEDRYEFVPPGSYVAQFAIDAGTGDALRSNRFELQVVEATGVDAAARDMVAKDCMQFFQGRDYAPVEEHYRVGGTWRKVDVSRFQRIQGVLDAFPKSEYAEWIRFWKVYHHGGVNEGIEYAREHSDFPLSDNLFLCKIEGAIARVDKEDGESLGRIDDLLSELLNAYPASDVRTQSLELLTKVRSTRKLTTE